MRAAQEEHVGLAGAGVLPENFVYINVRDLLGHWMLHPALFHQRHEQRAGFLRGFQSKRLQGLAIGMAGNRGFGGDHRGFSGF